MALSSMFCLIAGSDFGDFASALFGVGVCNNIGVFASLVGWNPGSDGRIHGACSSGAKNLGHASGCFPVVLDGILVRSRLVDGSSRLWLAVCIHGELRSVAVIVLVLDWRRLWLH